MSMTTSTNNYAQPPMFGAFCTTAESASASSGKPSPASTPPKRRIGDSDGGSSGGHSREHVKGDSEASSLASDRESAELAAAALADLTPDCPPTANFTATATASQLQRHAWQPPQPPPSLATAAHPSFVGIGTPTAAAALSSQPPPPLAASLPTATPVVGNNPASAVAADDNDLFVHVLHGETISLAVGSDLQLIAGW